MIAAVKGFRPKKPFAVKKAAAARAGILAQWRGVDSRSLEEARRHSARSASDVLAVLLKDIGLEKKQADLEILKVWNEALSPDIVAHAKPINLHKGTLFVAVENAVWLSEIVRYRSREILARLQHSFGKDLIVRISFRAG
jgi:hypothetical protein